MKQETAPLRLATSLFLAAAALPLTPLAAQDTQTQAPVDITPPPAPPPAQTPPVIDTSPVQAPAPTPPAAETAPPAETVAPVAEEAPATRRAPARTTARARPRTTAQPRAEAPIRRAAPALAAPAADPAPVAEALPPAAPTAELPVTAAPVLVPEALPVDTPPAAEPQQSGGGISPELLAGALALVGLAAIAFLFTRRRRRRLEEDSYGYQTYDEPTVAAAPLAFERQAPAEQPVEAPAAAAAAAAGGRPWLALDVRPVRAGVGDERACVEFELSVDNQGSAPAEDVRISTFMLAAGPGQESEMERMLIDPPPAARFPEPIYAGDGKRISTAVALPRNELEDSVLPVVVAEARYRLPDGSEGRTSASFTVGVPWGEELAHFDVENPSGLHEGVEARLHGEPQRV